MYFTSFIQSCRAQNKNLHLFIQVEYHANENPLKNSEKNSMCWSKVNLSNNQNKNTLPL